MLNTGFSYLNRYYILRASKVGPEEVFPIASLVKVIWREHFYTGVLNRINASAFMQLVEEREKKDPGNSADLKVFVQSLIDMGIFHKTKAPPGESSSIDKRSPNFFSLKLEAMYQTGLYLLRQFFDKYLSHTREYYNGIATNLLKGNITTYLNESKRMIQEETQRCNFYFSSCDSSRLQNELTQAFVTSQSSTISSVADNLLDERDVSSLESLFFLLSRVPSMLPPIAEKFEAFVTKVGKAAVANVAESAINDPKLYVDSLLDFFRIMNQMFTTSFQKSKLFETALEKGCRRVVNNNAVTEIAKTPSRSSELMARHLDSLLKAKPTPEGTPSNTTDVESNLDDLLNLFRFIEDKDVFQSFYARSFAKRLLNQLSASEDLERRVVEKLKSACGNDYISKLQKMLNDINKSKNFTTEWKNHSKSEKNDISFYLLTSAIWPIQLPVTSMNLPKELMSAQESFSKFYLNKSPSHVLTWQYQLSKGELRASCFAKVATHSTYVLQVSSFQLGILLYFNDKDTATCEKLHEELLIPDDQFQMSLKALTYTKVLIASAERNADDNYDKSVSFTLNTKFNSKQPRLQLNVVVQGAKAKEAEVKPVTQNEIDQERQVVLESVVVRVMKAKKRLPHHELVEEVIEAVKQRFHPQVQTIKKAIEHLLEKDYIARVDGEKDVYVYVP
eukprot:TRINITY_DN15356_c0_g1_i1.p1 TRINITY_DN15356_c0_g1~~TRINITY_DN15356_c0_g1_i1.p1  ORF type:complete len:789 (+),score=208.05 TRINITY_DN15356_c0_g1_i1:345-2369(+)